MVSINETHFSGKETFSFKLIILPLHGTRKNSIEARAHIVQESNAVYINEEYRFLYLVLDQPQIFEFVYSSTSL